MRRLLAAILFASLYAPCAVSAQNRDIARIVDEGTNHSAIMMNAHELFDRIGSRLTNSSGIRRAEEWAIDKFESYGATDVRREAFDFGRGWEIVDVEVDMISPRPVELTAIPLAWTPATNGPVEAEVVVAPMRSKADFEAYRGKMSGKIVMISLPGTGDRPTQPAFKRRSSQELADMDAYRVRDFDPEDIGTPQRRVAWPRAYDDFLAQEGALAVVINSYRDGKLVHGHGYRYRIGDTPKLPQIEMAAEDYRRLARLAKIGPAPRLRIDTKVRWHDEDTNAYNIIADIKGSDASAGYVMAGAHYDSWAAADGAVDNGSGTVVVMEAARILATLGKRPKRTIRFALWAAEEQGLRGSRAYIDRHLAKRPVPDDVHPDTKSSYYSYGYPIEPLSGYGDLKLYLNMDNGSGRVRGIYAENNLGATNLLSK